MTQEEVMTIFRDTKALLEGHFELRSGLHSDRFFQCAKVLCYPGLAGRLCNSLVDKMRGDMGEKLRVASVIAPAMGGLVVGHEIARILDVRSIFAEKKEGVLLLRRFKIDKGERVVIAEDVVTRGGRIQETIDIVKNAGGEIVALAFLVDRSSGDVSFDYPTYSLLRNKPLMYEPDKCPLCDKGLPLVHPGS